jgi:hypothetical protein
LIPVRKSLIIRRKKEEGTKEELMKHKGTKAQRKKEEEAIKLMLGVINKVKYSRFLYILYKKNLVSARN